MFAVFARTKITVEPILLLHNMATQMVFVTSLDLMERKACLVNLGYSSYICDNLDTYETEESEVQSLVSEYVMWRSILEAAIKLISVPLLGWWADTYGGRGPLMFSILFLVLESGTFLVNTLASSWPLEAFLLGSFCYGISGGTHALLMLSFSYLAHETQTIKRTRRMGILDGFYYLGSPLGLAIAPPVRTALGFCGIFGSSILINSLIFLYILAFLRSGKPHQNRIEGASTCSNLGIDKLTDSFYVTFKKSPYRKYILILILAMLLDSFVIWGESSVKYLFTQKSLDWDYNQYSHYGTASSLLTAFGALVIVPFLTKLSLSDALIGLIGAISRCLERVTYILASILNLGWIMYIGSVIGSASPLAPTSIRSHLSKLASDDVAQVYAVMAVGESLLPFATAPIYTNIYNRTVDGFISSFFLLSIAVNMLMGCCFIYVYFSTRGKTQVEETASSSTNN